MKGKILKGLILTIGTLLCTTIGDMLSDKKNEIKMQEAVKEEVEKQLKAKEPEEEVEES